MNMTNVILAVLIILVILTGSAAVTVYLMNTLVPEPAEKEEEDSLGMGDNARG